MSSSHNQSPRSSRSTPFTNEHMHAHNSSSPELVSSAETDMHQPSASTLEMDSSIDPTALDGVEASTQTPTDDSSSNLELSSALESSVRQHPIPPASEPMQYRAIGLVHGRYTPSDDQFTRGSITTDDGTLIDAVLLGRVMSLVRKHLDLTTSHLWVVYPRTREKVQDLHVQIVGVWEPEKLTPADSVNSSTGNSASDGIVDAATSTAQLIPSPVSAIVPHEATPQLEDGYFSIRGEVLFCSPEDNRLIVRVQQAAKKSSKKSTEHEDDEEKSFKVILSGTLEGKAVGYFWDLYIQRQGNDLVLQNGSMIALVPPRKRKVKPGGFRGNAPGRKKPWDAKGSPPRPARRVDSAAPVSAPPTRREPISKPVKRPKDGN